MPQENRPIVVSATWVAASSRQVSARDDLLRLLRPQIEKLLRDLSYGTDLMARATLGFEQLFSQKHRAARGADVVAERATADEYFLHEKDCQTIVRACAKKLCGYGYPKRDPRAITRICDITARHDRRHRHTSGLHRDTVVAILAEADPRTGRWHDRGNRERSILILINGFACEFWGDGEGGISARAADEIASLVRNEGDAIQVEVVREILKNAERAVEPMF